MPAESETASPAAWATCRGATLLEVARQERALEQVVRMLPQGFRLAALASAGNRPAQLAAHARDLEQLFQQLARQSDILLVDAELGDDGMLPVPALAAGESWCRCPRTPPRSPPAMR